ncbi:hypothetical protein D9757_014898 [Collybiopsis confluens]|uniref:Uncharacterized protein n=1 Tax=Collybiopsis confluens TaxID=2823264 RepID=A0A8H5FQM4_9AGAR|nr:hypothetical protein D9757_014898 [Collybiopsis confluens]
MTRILVENPERHIGGFAPPTPSLVATLTRPQNGDNLNISVASREDGTPQLSSFAPKSLGISASVGGSESATDLIKELHSILKNLPTEQPPGSEDIYALDTSIAWQSEDLEWCNGGPAGVSGFPGSSSVQASKEEKDQFKRAVEIVDTLIGEAK